MRLSSRLLPCMIAAAAAPQRVAALPSPAAATAAGYSAINLRVNYLDAPITIDDATPTFSWETQAAEGARAVQATYTLKVQKLSMSAHPVGEALGAAVLSSASNMTQFVPLPAGLTLESDTSYAWSVTSAGGVATSAVFSTALLQQSDWAASQWIGGSSTEAVLMRKEFAVNGAVTRARIFVAVPGYGQVSVNGHDVDGEAGTRTWTQYDKRTLYHTYDVAKYLVPGTNVIGLHVGKGWYGHWKYGGPTARALLNFVAGGKATAVATDATWSQGFSPVLADDEYNGVTYDARNETAGWDTATCAACATWKPVTSGAAAAPKISNTTLSSAAYAQVEVMHTFTAKWMREPSPGVYVFDFEQNMAGWVKVRVKGRAGTTIHLRHAEVLMHPPYGPRDGNIYVGNLRSAKATEKYVLNGNPEGEVFTPVFTQHGFRYVELTVTGIDEPFVPSLDMLEGVNIRSAVEQTGHATFDDLMMNQVQHNILWGQADNLMMIPTDCDNRDERLGWTGDSALSADEASLNYDMGAFFHNWARQLDDNSPNGAIGCTVPTGPGGGNIAADKSCDASWTSVYPSVVWSTMKFNGDLGIVRDNWVGMTRFMDNEINRATKQGLTKMFANFGDWVPPPGDVPGGAEGKVSTSVTASFSFVNDLGHMADMAHAVGNAADLTKYGAAFSKYKKAWHTAFYVADKGHYVNGGQTAQVLGLQLGCAPPDVKPKILAALVGNILAHQNHTTCGIIGWRFELDVLSKNGHGELAWALVTQQTYPSFGFEILNADEPATTIWELWDGPSEGPGMNSRNHIMFGAPGDWVYLYAAGLAQTEASLGFAHATFTPPARLLQQVVANFVPDAAANQTISAAPRWGGATKRTQRGLYAIGWSFPPAGGKYTSCALNAESKPATVGCEGGGHISAIKFAEYGSPTGECGSAQGLLPGKCAYDLKANLTSLCVGKASCAVDCVGPSCTVNGVTIPTGDPCYDTKKQAGVEIACAGGGGGSSVPPLTVKATVPPGAVGTTFVPLLGVPAAKFKLEEGTTPVWDKGAFVAGAEGVLSAKIVALAGSGGDAVAVEHSSGSYVFVSGSD